MSVDQPDPRPLLKIVTFLGVLCGVTALALIVTMSPGLGWIVAVEAFAFAVAAMVYHAETRPQQKHRVK